MVLASGKSTQIGGCVEYVGTYREYVREEPCEENTETKGGCTCVRAHGTSDEAVSCVKQSHDGRKSFHVTSMVQSSVISLQCACVKSPRRQ